MSGTDETPPVAADDFPEFAAPPVQKPDLAALEERRRAVDEAGAAAQQDVDAVIARVRAKRADSE